MKRRTRNSAGASPDPEPTATGKPKVVVRRRRSSSGKNGGDERRAKITVTAESTPIDTDVSEVSSSNASSCCDQLPTEMLQHIFGYLTLPEDLCNVSKVSRRWKRTSDSDYVWKNMFHYTFGNGSSSRTSLATPSSSSSLANHNYANEAWVGGFAVARHVQTSSNWRTIFRGHHAQTVAWGDGAVVSRNLLQLPSPDDGAHEILRGPIRSLAYHSEQDILASGSRHKVIRLFHDFESKYLPSFRRSRFDASSAKKDATPPPVRSVDLEGHTGAICALDWHRRSGHLIRYVEIEVRTRFIAYKNILLHSGAARPCNSVRFWDMQTGECRAVFAGDHIDAVFSLTSTDTTLMTGGGQDDKTCKVYDIMSTTMVSSLLHSGSVRAVKVLDDHTFFTASLGKQLCMWDLRTCEHATTEGKVKAGAHCLQVDEAKNQVWVSTGRPDNAIYAFDYRRGLDRPLFVVRGNSKSAIPSFAMDAWRVVSVAYDGKVNVYQRKDHLAEEPSPLPPHLVGNSLKHVDLWNGGSAEPLGRMDAVCLTATSAIAGSLQGLCFLGTRPA